MKKIIGLVFLFSIFALGLTAHAQMMGHTTTAAETAATMKDEAEGKAVWDKLQNKQVTCANLTDDDFDVLGDFFMGNMAGTNHATMNEMMADRLGDAGEKAMHVAIGKRMSGCDKAAALPRGAEYFTPMMGGDMMGNDTDSQWGNDNDRGMMMGYMHGGGAAGGFHYTIATLFALALFAFLVSGSVFFWKGSRK